jgi:hypothetical protein
VVAQEGEQNTGKAGSVDNEAELIGRIIQSEQKLTEYFTTIITKSVTEQIERRNLARLRLVGVVSVVLVSVIIPAVTLWIRGTINSQTEVAIQSHFSEAIEQLDTRFADQTARLEQNFESFLDDERTYLTFANYALYLADRSQVPERELTNTLAVLDQIAGKPPLTSRPDFPFLVDLVVRTAIRHGYRDTLTALEDRLQTVLAASPRTMPRLARFYAESVVGDRFTSERKLQIARDKFQNYLDLSHSAPDFVNLLPLQLMVEKTLHDEGAAERIEAIQLYVLDLTPAQKASFIAETVRYSNPDFRDVPATARYRRIGAAAGRLVVNQAKFYADMLRDNAVQAAITQLANHEANMENTGIATALTAFRRVFAKGLASGENPKLRDAVRKLVSSEINTWLKGPVIAEAIRAQNLRTSAYSQEHIDDLESQWKDEFVSDQYDLIAKVLDRPVSRYLRRVKLNALGTYHEILLMDGVGLLAGASDANDDYWQGDEPKWVETYGVGKDALHISNLKFDESALAWEIQISLPIIDPDTDAPIGAVTIGLDPSALVDTSD